MSGLNDFFNGLFGFGSGSVTKNFLFDTKGSSGSLTSTLTDPKGWWDTFKNGETNVIARENLDYQKALQQQIFEREDTAYQRSVNDMRLAGLNPLSMNGTDGAGEVVDTTPPEDMGNLAALTQVFNMFNTLRAGNASANLQNAQAANLQSQTTTNDLFNQTYAESLSVDLLGKQFENEIKNFNLHELRRNAAFNDIYGLSDNMTPELKSMAFLVGHGPLSTVKPNYESKATDLFGSGVTHAPYDYTKNLDFTTAMQSDKILNYLLKILGTMK